MKKIISILCLFTICLSLTGCIKRDSMEDITIYTTNYPIEYITNELYGEFSKVHSIYPDGIDIDSYKLTNKQISDYSQSDLYIFNGLSNEKSYVNKMREANKNLKIIDTTLAMEYTNGVEELWLDPSNFLMMAQNVKTGFSEYTDSYYLNNSISEKYEELKIEASNLDAKIKQNVTNGDTKVIVADSNLFKYLEKYDLTVYSLEDEDTLNDRTLNEIKNLIANGTVSHIFAKANAELNEETQKLVDETGVEVSYWHTLANISESERSANEDYFTIMNDNLELLKDELYN